MLVGGGVIHGLNTERPHNRFTATLMANIAQQRVQFNTQLLRLIDQAQITLMAYNENSDCSNNTSVRGRWRIIWRHNSEPMEPHAPVTSTDF